MAVRLWHGPAVRQCCARLGDPRLGGRVGVHGRIFPEVHWTSAHQVCEAGAVLPYRVSAL